MSADIVESTYLMLLITYQKQGQPRHRYRAYITAVRQLVGESGKHPAIGKQLFLFQLKEVIADVSRTGQTVSNHTDIIEMV